MNNKARRAMLSTAMLVLVLNTGCGRSANRELAQAFVAKFDSILEKRKVLDNLEGQARQYDEQLEKALQEPSKVKRAKALGAWIAQYRALLSQAQSIVESESPLVDTLVSDSARFTGDANKYGRETTDALREHISMQRQALEVGDEIIAVIESSIDESAGFEPKKFEDLSKSLEVLDAKEKQAFQRAQDALARLHAVAL